MDTTNFIDIVLLLLVLAGLIVGYKRGFVRQVIELGGLIAAFSLALIFAGTVAGYLGEKVSLPYTPALMIGFIAVFAAAMLAVRILAAGLQKIIQMTLLNWVDRLTGALLGLIMGMVVASLLIAFITAAPIPGRLREGFDRSNISNFLEPVAPRIFNLVFDHGSGSVDFDKIFRRSESA